LSAEANSATAAPERAPSQWSAFAHAAFTVIWLASVFSNVGTAMFDTASGWLITSLNANPLAVSLVQVAVSLPLFLFTLPAGALADVIDSRRLLIGVEVAIIFISVIFAALVSLNLVNSTALLLTTFLLGAGGALTSPAWAAIIPQLVPRRDLDSATSANSIGFNLSRAVGPALGGLIIAVVGLGAPFWIFAISNVGIVASLLWWKPPPKATDGLPAERLISAVRTGIRYAMNNEYLGATLFRALAFFPFATAYWALLPLVARAQMTGGPENYGLLLGALGVGAIGGSFVLNRLKEMLGPDRLVAWSTVVTAVALFLFGIAHGVVIAVFACLIAGATWTLVLSVLYVSAQVALPDWVRGRGLAIFLTVIFGATTVGSAVWGQLAAMAGLAVAHFIAAVVVVAAIPLTWHWKLQTGATVDMTPSMHWRAPAGLQKIENNRGPVLMTLDYNVDPANREAFLHSLDALRHERKRDGAFAWGCFEDLNATGRFVETFLIESWLEVLHARERVTNADKMIEEQVFKLLANEPKLTIMIAAERPHRSLRLRAHGPYAAPPADASAPN
jgi:MFS family permease